MGLTLSFIIGDKDEIVDAIAFEDYEYIDEIESSELSADFSFHLIPDDLNILFKYLGKAANSQIDELRKYLDFDKCFFDEEDRGACFVSDTIKNSFSDLDINQAELIAEKWINDLSSKCGEPIQVKDYHVDAVKDLIMLIKSAKSKGLDLVHYWYL